MTPKRVFFAMIVAVVLVLGAGGAIFSSLEARLASKAAEIGTLKSSVDILDAKIKNSEEAAAELEKHRDVQKILDDVLPPEKIQNDIVAEILEIGNRNNTKFRNISFPSSGAAANFDTSQTKPVKDAPGVLGLDINLDFTASYEEILTVLEDFEANQRKIQVVEVGINPALNEDGLFVNQFSVTLKIRAYQRAA